MAIYSCNISSIGRTTHAPGTAGAHIRYITRQSANPIIMSMNMPEDPVEARNWIDRQERAMRKNARVIDKIRIALPIELSEDERYILVKDFMAELSDHRVPWYAAIHQTGEDEHNPHVHIAVHDRSVETGRRELRLSDSARDRQKDDLPGPKAVDWLRERWEAVCNDTLQERGHETRIDRRTLEDQGIDREPTIHEGPRAQHIDSNVKRPRSKKRENGCGRVIDYPSIDKGKTRREFNAHIIDLNLEKAARSDNPVAAAWAEFEKHQMELDRKLEKELAGEKRKRTEIFRNRSSYFEAKKQRIAAEWRLKRKSSVKSVQDEFRLDRDEMRLRQKLERKALQERQGAFYARLLAILDITGTTRRKHQLARKELVSVHKSERHQFSQNYLKVKKKTLDELRQRFQPEIQTLRSERSKALKSLSSSFNDAERADEVVRQTREMEREQIRRVTEKKIAEWLRERKKQPQAATKEKLIRETVSIQKEFGKVSVAEKPKKAKTRDNHISDESISDNFNDAAKQVEQKSASHEDLTKRSPSTRKGAGWRRQQRNQGRKR